MAGAAPGAGVGAAFSQPDSPNQAANVPIVNIDAAVIRFEKRMVTIPSKNFAVVTSCPLVGMK
jgi:hypothetical protein